MDQCTDVEISPTWRNLKQKASAVLWTLGWGQWKGVEFREKGYEWKSTGYLEWGKSVFKVSPSFSHKGASAEVPEKNLCPRPQIKRPRDEGTGTKKANML